MIEPSLAELVRRAIESRVADIHVSIPGIVRAYDAAKQVAQVIPAVNRVIFDDNGDPHSEDHRPIENVPVVWPGGGGFYLHFPLAEGDSGQLVFSERSIAEWRNTGRVATPSDLRAHGMSYPVFVPGLRHDGQAREDAPGSGEGVISVGDGVLRVGDSSGSQFVALANLVNARFAAIHDALASVLPASPSGPDVGEPGLLALQIALAAPFEPVDASKLRTK